MNVKERFLKYVSYPTMSSEESTKCPSTEKQLALAEELVREFHQMGIENAKCDSFGYVTASIEATAPTMPKIGFIAHLDTSPDAPDENVNPREILYTGGDIILNSDKNIVMRESEHASLWSYVGDRLVVTDGTTLLGADDKAGVAEIMTAAEALLNSKDPHGKISIAFTPDEEIGRGADRFDVGGFDADFAYTVDGGALGELEFENFNAASGKLVISGISIHPGSAKDKMVNAAKIACEFPALLPAEQTPERTEGYEGFFHLISVSGGCERAELSYIIRDHDKEKFEDKKRIFKEAAQEIEKKHVGCTVQCTVTDSYYNMRKIMQENMHVVERARDAFSALGITPTIRPIRGGTDGARLSFMGLPCPNLSTGGENFHSRFEFISVDAMEKMVDVIVKIATMN